MMGRVAEASALSGDSRGAEMPARGRALFWSLWRQKSALAGAVLLLTVLAAAV